MGRWLNTAGKVTERIQITTRFLFISSSINYTPAY